jgi:hypothetical protein
MTSIAVCALRLRSTKSSHAACWRELCRRPLGRPSSARRLKGAVALDAGIGVVIGTGVWWLGRNAPATASPAALRITAKGPVLVVESPDGRRWIVGPPPARQTGGNYVIVLR